MEYLAGRRTIFELPIRLHGTDFQRHVWHVLTDINRLRHTYGMLALMAGCEGGSRAVGSAVGANPLHVIIPCHRVVEKSGRIGGYAGGGAVKFELLAREGKVVSVNAVPGRGFTRLIADAIPKVMGVTPAASLRRRDGAVLKASLRLCSLRSPFFHRRSGEMHMTEANSRMARLETDPVLREEAETIRIMTAMYCRGPPRHVGAPLTGSVPNAAPSSRMRSSALRAVRTVRRSPSAPSAASIVIAQREKAQAREVMRHAGPRLAASHPVLPSGIL